MFRIRDRTRLDKIIITAMDRFVWFILLVVMSHLVTEFTRVTGYARGNRNEFAAVNDTLIEPRTIQNLLLYPEQQDNSQYEPYYYQGGNAINNYQTPYHNIEQRPEKLQQQQQQQAQQTSNDQIIISPSGAPQGFTFSFRPLIDSIFEIPISTLRAVNNLVSRLTGSYQSALSPPYSSQKSAPTTTTTTLEVERSNNVLTTTVVDASKTIRNKKSSLLREAIE